MSDPTTERAVRAMLEERAQLPQPAPPPWRELDGRGATVVPMAHRGAGRGRSLRAPLAAVAAAAVVALGVVTVSGGRDRDGVVVAGPGSTATTPAPASPGARTHPAAVWPVTTPQGLDQAQREFDAGGRRELATPESAALAYLTDRLPARAHVVGGFLQGDANSGEVTYRLEPAGRETAKGTVLVRRSGEGAIWTVVASTVDRIIPRQIGYDGRRITGSVAVERSGGTLGITYRGIDGSDPIVDESHDLAAGDRHTIDERFGGKPGVVLLFRLTSRDGIETMAEVRSDHPGATVPPKPSGVTCSTTDLQVDLEHQDGLPPKVALMRGRIIEAALACDYDGLQRLALEGPSPAFTATYGDPERGLAEYWRAREADGEPVLRLLVQTLDLRPILQSPPPGEPGPRPEPQWVWPAVSGTSEPRDRDWDDLRPLYGDAAVDEARTMGAWYGYRAGITVDGDWIYFVAGD